MFHEVYAPQNESELVWSRQKLVALGTWLESVLHGRRPSRLLVLYGPSGCAKHTTLRVVLKKILEPHASQLQLREWHSCESTPVAFAGRLQEMEMLLQSDSPEGGDRLPLTDGGSKSNTISSTTSMIPALPSTSTSASTSKPSAVVWAHVMKFYGETEPSAFHALLNSFLMRYEQLQTLSRGNATLAAGLSRHLIVFVHTLHDSHSEKADLHRVLPSRFFSSSCVELFHCTPITPLALKRRLRSVLAVEAQRRRGAGEGCNLPLNSNLNLQLKNVEKVSSPTLRPRALLTEEELDVLAVSSRGDIRQALLQAQWTCLLPESRKASSNLNSSVPASASTPACWGLQPSKSSSAAEEDLARRVAAASRSRQDDRPPLLPVKDAKNEKEQKEVGPQSSASSQQRSRAGSNNSSLSSLTSSRRSSPCSSNYGRMNKNKNSSRKRNRGCFSLPSWDGMGVETALATSSSTRVVPASARAVFKKDFHGPRRGPEGVAPVSPRLPPCHSTAFFSTSGEPTTALGIFTAIEELAEASSRSSHEPPSATRLGGTYETECVPNHPKNRKSKKIKDHHGKNTMAPYFNNNNNSNNGNVMSGRLVQCSARDECLSLAHAAARLLTQKHALSDVLPALPVSPRALLGYLLNNLLHYFTPDQIDVVAACTSWGSEVDLLIAVEGATRGYVTGPSFFASFSAFRQNGLETPGALSGSLEKAALVLFDLAYRVRHRTVSVPRVLLAQQPPPFVPAPFPRVRKVTSSELRKGRFAHSESHNTFSTSTTSTLSASASLGLLREKLPAMLHRCSALESVLLDYVGVGRWIVLRYDNIHDNNNHKLNNSRGGSTPPPVSSADVSRGPSLSRAAASVPRRTVFNFTSLPRRVVRRGCPVGWVQLLQRHPPLQHRQKQNEHSLERPALREDRFYFTSDEIQEAGTGECEAGDPTEGARTWLPEGETIEEYSD